MAKLTDEYVYVKDQAGERHSEKFTVTVDREGTFYATVPEYLQDVAQTFPKAVWHNGRVRLSAPRLSELLTDLQKAMKDYHAMSVERELVIFYDYTAKASFWKTVDGIYLPNGYFDNGEGGGWKGQGNLHSVNLAPGYSVQLAARCLWRCVYTRGAAVKVVAEYPKDEDLGEQGHLLNGFRGFDRNWLDCKYLPYTEEAAKFFVGAMLAMCGLADRLAGYFGDEASVRQAIAAGANLALPAPSSSAK